MALKFLFYGCGIFFSYLLFGIYQEKVTRKTHGQNNERFTSVMTLVLLQCIVNTLFAKFMLLTFMKTQPDRTSWKYFSIASLTYLVAMVSSNSALHHVSYPTQVVAKSCKPIPIMIMAVLFSGKRYSAMKYFLVSLIVVGVAIFMYKKQIEFNSSFNFELPTNIDLNGLLEFFKTSIGTGEALLVLSLAMDGLTGAVQEKMKSNYQTKSVHMMYRMNLWSSIYLLIAICYSGEYNEFLAFVTRHPAIIYDIAMFSALSAIGQLFIFLTIAEFGPLSCSIITTTRKFFTVLFSVFLMGNNLTKQQWIGTSLVFTGLTLDSVFKQSSSSSSQAIIQRKRDSSKKTK